ncbi:DUF5085 family protein [Bacillus sp. 1NLA3E]|uniref:DUF5085 family protein n=1 Tax=Bacillus sp. 1NLA3E TaxID=666686 RepID=UPI000247ECD3|nr:DUF5085 family protein [Bacillus sp. 1NLA3E]AGK55705.1 hypothetical protein B1NLA3E_19805 [Bacillus sp. 1NLA3E]
MINPNDHIRYTNVISRKYRFHYQDMEKVMTDFLNDIVKIKASIKGPMYYSINNVPLDEIINGEVFIPVNQDSLEIMDDMYFHSYFSIENMISLCLSSSNFERDTEIAYKMLIDYMEHNGLTQVTPIFHVLSGDETLHYIYIKIGVFKEDFL